jgi:DNA-binding response OmpR family regulator
MHAVTDARTSAAPSNSAQDSAPGTTVAALTDTHTEQAGADPRRLKVLLYSDDRQVRQSVVIALGRRPAPELPAIEIVECATEPLVIRTMSDGGFDLAILDGEATPAGGLGICKQLKDEIFRCPPILVLIGRPQDAWLATWSRADAVVPQPLDPRVLADAAASLLRRRVAGIEAVS